MGYILATAGFPTVEGFGCGRYREICLRTFTRVYRKFNTGREVLFETATSWTLNQNQANVSKYAVCIGSFHECLFPNGMLVGYIVFNVGVDGGRRPEIYSITYDRKMYTPPLNALLIFSERARMVGAARCGTKTIVLIKWVRLGLTRAPTNLIPGVHDQPSYILDMKRTSSGLVRCW